VITRIVNAVCVALASPVNQLLPIRAVVISSTSSASSAQSIQDLPIGDHAGEQVNDEYRIHKTVQIAT
jgi:hypothetical protein